MPRPRTLSIAGLKGTVRKGQATILHDNGTVVFIGRSDLPAEEVFDTFEKLSPLMEGLWRQKTEEAMYKWLDQHPEANTTWHERLKPWHESSEGTKKPKKIV